MDYFNTFHDFDYNIYKNKYPTYAAYIFSLINIVFNIMILLSFPFTLIVILDKLNKCTYIFIQICISTVFIGLNSGILIYSATILNKNLNDLHKIKVLEKIDSDDFIKGFIKEFKENCKPSPILIPAISILGSSILIHIIGFILFLISICCDTI